MSGAVEHVAGLTTRSRRGEIRLRFCHGVGFVLIDVEESARGPGLFSRNRFNLMPVHDRDHGGPLKQGSLRRPLGALRGYLLIHWQALRLMLRGARYRVRPAPPHNEVT